MNFKHLTEKIKKIWLQWQHRPQPNLTPLWAVILILVVIGNSFLVYFNFFYTPKPSQLVEADPATNTVDGYVSPLTGLETEQDVSKIKPVALMIDNYDTARPQSGIGQADIVFETYVEGGVTRLMAVFQTADEIVIGPVRSAREYFLPLVNSLDAVYGHSGGSPSALSLLSKGSISDADEFKYGSSYYRNRLRSAPHNLYTTTSLLAELVSEKNWNEWSMAKALSFSSEVPTGESAKHILIKFSLPAYNVRWNYNTDDATYSRFVGGQPSIDADTKKVVSTKNIAILFTEVRPAPRPNYPDAVYVETIGSGEALFVRDGVVVNGKWRISDSGQIEFLQSNGSTYALAKGNTWVEIVSADIPNNVAIE